MSPTCTRKKHVSNCQTKSDKIAFEEMKESLINSGLDEQSAKGKAYSNIYSVSNIYIYIYIYITPEGTGLFLCGTFLVDETTKERASTFDFYPRRSVLEAAAVIRETFL